MPEASLQSLNALLWDLRARYERQLRALTDTQRLLDQYRMYPHTRAELRDRFRMHIEHVIESNRLLIEVTEQLRPIVDRLPGRSDEGPTRV